MWYRFGELLMDIGYHLNNWGCHIVNGMSLERYLLECELEDIFEDVMEGDNGEV